MTSKTDLPSSTAGIPSVLNEGMSAPNVGRSVGCSPRSNLALDSNATADIEPTPSSSSTPTSTPATEIDAVLDVARLDKWPGYPGRCEMVLTGGMGLILCGKNPCLEHGRRRQAPR